VYKSVGSIDVVVGPLDDDADEGEHELVKRRAWKLRCRPSRKIPAAKVPGYKYLDTRHEHL
jgi:hypothetical protein